MVVDRVPAADVGGDRLSEIGGHVAAPAVATPSKSFASDATVSDPSVTWQRISS